MIDVSFFAPEDRAKRYRKFAAQARADAQRFTGALHFHYLMLAEDWDIFAEDIEDSFGEATALNSLCAPSDEPNGTA